MFFKFSNYNFFLIFGRENLKIKWKDSFKKKNLRRILTKLPHMAFLEKSKIFFRKKLSIFPNKTQTLNVLRTFSIPVAAYSKFATIRRKIDFTFRREQNCRCWREQN